MRRAELGNEIIAPDVCVHKIRAEIRNDQHAIQYRVSPEVQTAVFFKPGLDPALVVVKMRDQVGSVVAWMGGVTDRP